MPTEEEIAATKKKAEATKKKPKTENKTPKSQGPLRKARATKSLSEAIVHLEEMQTDPEAATVGGREAMAKCKDAAKVLAKY